ncbi:hypothetical protein LZL87_013191 [Fusarium oxysporum]|nr:hypothetical protein LZL87_013191 [Fusarium oxysporum]
MYPPVEGDGNVSAIRIKDGRVDMKARYVDTERLKFERGAGQTLFGLYRNPFTNHPCVRAAVDSTASTNLVYWGDQLLVLIEGGLPYAMDPDTLETRGYDPFKVPGITFTAHLKVDSISEELIWVTSPWCVPIHDCVITTNFVVLFLWPFKADVDRMKIGSQHWAWSDDEPATFIVVPRLKERVPVSWQPGEYRVYKWRSNAFMVHAASAWEDDAGKIFLVNASADFVLWEIDPSQPNNSVVPDPTVVLDLSSEFSRVDERFIGRYYNVIFLPVILPGKQPNGFPMPLSLDGLAKVDKQRHETEFFCPGNTCLLEKPIFIPRSNVSPEGDGWIIVLVQRHESRKSDLVVLDTSGFSQPVAIIELPLFVRNQTHGRGEMNKIH